VSDHGQPPGRDVTGADMLPALAEPLLSLLLTGSWMRATRSSRCLTCGLAAIRRCRPSDGNVLLRPPFQLAT
jgi:hypothetical protein